MEMGEKIKTLRKAQGLTLEQVGQAVGVGKSTVRKWEEGDIQNMRRDKIAALASALRTTPEFLMGWNQREDRWTANLRENVASILENCEPVGAADAGVDLEHLSAVASGEIPVSLAEACYIADEIGCTVDELVNEKTDREDVTDGLSDLDRQLIELLKVISHDQKMFLLAQLKTLAHQNEEKEETPF